MAAEELELISLKNDFYRDGYYKTLTAIGVLLAVIILLLSTSIYLFIAKPKPVSFAVGDEFRTLLPVPVNKPYLSQPDLIQWVSDVLPNAFTLDFLNYDQELKNSEQYFTANGWKTFLEQLKTYADSTNLNAGKLFVNASAAGAPVIVNQALLPEGMYAWLIQMPLNLSYSSVTKGSSVPIVIQVLIVRVPTLNNLAGIAIEKLTVVKGSGDQVISNG